MRKLEGTIALDEVAKVSPSLLPTKVATSLASNSSSTADSRRFNKLILR